MSDTREQLSPVTVVLHWLIGLTMIGMVIFGMILADYLPKDYPKADKSALIGLHKSIGTLVLVFAAWRLVRRLRIGLPQHVGSYKTWEQHLAKTIHYVLLFSTIALPVSGILYTLGSARPISVFGVTVIPQLFAVKNVMLASLSRGTHDIMGKVLLVAVALHIAGALKHHIVDKDGTLRRMFGARVTATRHV
jgi:cytochrome b561